MIEQEPDNFADLLPEPEFDYEAVSPSQEEVLLMFADYLAVGGETGEVVPINESFGAIRVPQQQPTAVVSVDFCEVLRLTGRACGAAIGNFHVEYPYAAATGVGEKENMALVRALMKADRVTPSEDAATILRIMQDIRALGALVVGNTSTLAGCEVATFKFIGEHYPGAFDGINFNTGGHHATEGRGTKAWAILQTMQYIDPTFATDPHFRVISIDDRPHHNQHFHEVFAGNNVSTYAPRCRGESPLSDHGLSVVTNTPLEAFKAIYDELSGAA